MSRKYHPGMTLVELLVVISIMVILLGSAVPLVRHGVTESRLREAARELNSQIQLAKSHAAETGKPCGIWLDTEVVQGIASPVVRTLYAAETPQTYTGDTHAAVCVVSQVGASWVASFDANSASLNSLCAGNDSIKFDFKGPEYRIASISPATAPLVWVATLDVSGVTLPRPTTCQYQVFRSPQKSSSIPTELPSGVVIDIGESGYGDSDIAFNTGAPVACSLCIMFHPDGSMQRIVFGDPAIAPQLPPESVNLLIGQIESATAPPGNENIKALSWWITITPGGRVSTNPNAWDSNLQTVAAARSLTHQ